MESQAELSALHMYATCRQFQHCEVISNVHIEDFSVYPGVVSRRVGLLSVDVENGVTGTSSGSETVGVDGEVRMLLFTVMLIT